jgi:ABC-2 type transport system permease protein
MTVNMEDFQHIQTPIMMVLLVGYYLAIMAGMFDGSVLIRIFSYVPGISCLLSPALLVIGDIGVIDVVISIVVLIVFNGLLIKYGLRIYKVGILNYSTDKMWKKIFSAVKNK